MSAQIISIANQKGGVGKTTTSINLAAALGRSGKKVMIIDMDPQGNASSGLGFDDLSELNTIYEVLLDDTPDTVESAVHETEFEGLYLMPASPDLVGAEVELYKLDDKNMVLSKRLENHFADEYDYIFIDCPPSLGLLTINALTASTGVIVPLQCEYFAMEGLSKILGTIDIIKGELNDKLELKGIVLTMSDKRTNLSRQVEEEVKEHFKGKVYRTVIYRNTKLGEAPSFGKPIIYYDLRSIGSENYLMLAQEVLRQDKQAKRRSRR